MASKRPDTKDVQKNKRSKQGLLDVLHSIAKKQEDDRKQYSRQVDYDDVFDSMLTEGTLDGIRLIPPPYLPGRMYELYEQSAILKTCVETYVDNVDGYGYDISSKLSADDNIQKESNPDVQILTEFFDSPNDVETFDRVREKLRRDHEVTGNAFLEVVRGRDSRPVLVFWVDAQRIRITATREPVICTVQVPRGGQLIDIQAEKRFRTFCMVASDGATSGPRVRYFKEYGDPRQLDAVTGQFAKDGENISADRLASELIHFKHGNGVYGYHVG